MRVLVFNCGSSSLKFELIEVDGGGQRGHSHLRGHPLHKRNFSISNTPRNITAKA